MNGAAVEDTLTASQFLIPSCSRMQDCQIPNNDAGEKMKICSTVATYYYFSMNSRFEEITRVG